MSGREQHLTARALSIAIAVMESVPRERRAETDMEEWEVMLAGLLPQETVREFCRAEGVQTVASIGRGELRPIPPEGQGK
jgi:hypothetical protein